MKRLLTFLASLPLSVKVASATLLLLGAGGIGLALLNTPTVVPQPSATFGAANGCCQLNAGLLTNGNAAGPFEPPATATNSFGIYGEYMIDPNGEGETELGSSGGATQGLQVSGTNSGAASIFYQKGSWWLPTIGAPSISSTTLGTNYNPGIYTWNGTNGCTSANGAGAREPSGTWIVGTHTAYIVDPGFLCGGNSTGTGPAVNVAAISGIGAQQTGAAITSTTCASNTPTTGQIQVTVNVNVPHGLNPGQSFTLGGYTTSAIDGTYAAVAGTTSTTLVGTNASNSGTCPGSITIGGSATVGAGSGAAISIAAQSLNPFTVDAGVGTGIQTNPGQRICGVFGELGTDSGFPGAQFADFQDAVTGAELPGSPVVSPWLNQGTANFTGYTVAGTQSPTTPALTVTAMNSYTGTGSWASYNSGTGYVTFTTSSNPGFIPGSEFTVSGMSPSGYNQTYVAVNGTSGTTIIGNPLSGPIGVPQANNPGASTGSGGSMVSIIMPGMQVVGASGTSSISPIGSFGSTGVGGTGTYGLTVTQGTFNVTITSVSGSTMTVSGVPTTALAVGQSITISGDVLTITGLGTGVGGAGTYTVSNPSSFSGSGTGVAAGTLGSSGSPVNIYAGGHFYATVAPANNTAGGTSTAVSRTTIGDMINEIGSHAFTAAEIAGVGQSGAGGNIANVGMLVGSPWPNTNGTPTTAGLNSLCQKKTDFQSWISTYASGGNWQSFYPLSDGGIWADASVAQFTGYISSASGTSGGTATLNLSTSTTGTSTVSAMPTSAVISGAGIPGCPSSCPTLTNPSTAQVTFGSGIISANVGSSGSPITMAAGNFKPASPLPVLNFTGSISGTTLTMNAMANSGGSPTNGAAAAFTGTLSGTYPNNTTLTVSSGTGIADGQCVYDGGVSISNTAPLCIISGSGTSWTVNNNFYTAAGIGTDTTMFSTNTAIRPGDFVTGAGIKYPVQVIGYGSGNGGPAGGTYILSNSLNGTVPSSGTEAMVMSGVGSGGAIAPGPALTISNHGLGVTYPITNSAALTGTLMLDGAYNTTALGGIPSAIQAQVSSTAGGPPISGCSACAWTTLSSATVSGGAWSGNAVNIPAGGPYWVSVRAANGTGYATLPSAIFVGVNMTLQGEGNASHMLTGTDVSWLQGFHQLLGVGGDAAFIYAGNAFMPGPAILNNFSPSFVSQVLGDRFTTGGTAFNSPSGLSNITNVGGVLLGAPINIENLQKNGTGPSQFFYGGLPQTQSIGIGDGSTKVFSSGGGFGGSSNPVATVSTDASGTMTVAGVMSITAIGSTAYITPGDSVSCTGCAAGAIVTAQAGPWVSALTGTGGKGTYQVSPPPASAITTAETMTITHNNLLFNTAWANGATILGSISGSTLTLDASNPISTGAMSVGMTLSDGGVNIPAGVTVTNCLTHCAPFVQASSTWQLSTSVGTVGSEIMYVTAGSSTPFFANSLQPPTPGIPITTVSPLSGESFAPIIQVGTFEVLVNGTVVCTDTNTFAYNELSGNCTGTGVTGFVNYITGAYSVSFTTAPASSANITAQWTNLMTNDNSGSFEQLDSFVQGVGAMANKTGGINAYLNIQQGNPTWPLGVLYQSRQYSFVFGPQFAKLHNGTTSGTALQAGQPRYEGPNQFYGVSLGPQDQDEWMQESTIASSWSGSVSGSGTTTSTLTLSGAATGPMWEGEVIECNPFALTCALPVGTEIVSLATGAWGANGSTYNLTSPTNFSSSSTGTIAMHNALFLSVPSGYVGPTNDVPVQNFASGIGGQAAETNVGGIASGRRFGARYGAQAAAILSGTPSEAEGPTVSRALPSPNPCDSSATYAPCLDIGTGSASYPASHSATWSGSVATITGGLSAGGRPFVPGMSLSCSGCNTGLVALSVSLPPTQSTATGAGQIGQTFTITASGTIGGAGSGTLTGGCKGTSGTGSNCIDIPFTLNTTGATSLETCGVNNLQGVGEAAPSSSTTGYTPPNGTCVLTGVGALVGTFRIGTAPLSDVLGSSGSPYDFGLDPTIETGAIFQNEAFTCNIVTATLVQCVLGPTYNTSSGAFSAIGQWAPGSTYVAYGDSFSTGLVGGLLGYPGGQSFPVTAGSGYSPSGKYTTGGQCALTSAGVPEVPVMGFYVSSGGAITNASPANIGVGSVTQCTFPVNFSFTASVTSIGAAGNTTMTVPTSTFTISGITPVGPGSSTMTTTSTPTIALAIGQELTPPSIATAFPVIITGGSGTTWTVSNNNTSSIGSGTWTNSSIVSGALAPGEVINWSGGPSGGATVVSGQATGQGGNYTIHCPAACSATAGTAMTSGPTSGSGGSITTPPLEPLQGIGGIATYNTDSNLMGIFLYDNAAVTALPNAFSLPTPGTFGEPGLPVRPFGLHRGLMVGG